MKLAYSSKKSVDLYWFFLLFGIITVPVQLLRPRCHGGMERRGTSRRPIGTQIRSSGRPPTGYSYGMSVGLLTHSGSELNPQRSRYWRNALKATTVL